MNRQRVSISLKQQGGFLLIVAIGFLLLISMLAFILSQKISASSSVQLLSALSDQSKNAAQSGLEEGMYRLTQLNQCEYFDREYDGLGLKSCSVEVSCKLFKIPGNKDSKHLATIEGKANCGPTEQTALSKGKVSLLIDAGSKHRLIYRVVE